MIFEVIHLFSWTKVNFANLLKEIIKYKNSIKWPRIISGSKVKQSAAKKFPNFAAVVSSCLSLGRPAPDSYQSCNYRGCFEKSFEALHVKMPGYEVSLIFRAMEKVKTKRKKKSLK